MGMVRCTCFVLEHVSQSPPARTVAVAPTDAVHEPGTILHHASRFSPWAEVSSSGLGV
jgi:hypothetical protein